MLCFMLVLLHKSRHIAWANFVACYLYQTELASRVATDLTLQSGAVMTVLAYESIGIQSFFLLFQTDAKNRFIIPNVSTGMYSTMVISQ